MTKGSEDKGNRKAALLLSGLVASSDDALEAFRKRRLGEDNELSTDKLGEMRDVLLALGETLVAGDEAAWARFEQARILLLEDEAEDEEAPEEDAAEEEPADSTPPKPPRIGEALDDGAGAITGSNKPSPWASLSASRPPPVAKRPAPPMMPAPVAPSEPVPPNSGASKPVPPASLNAPEPVPPPSLTAPEPVLDPPTEAPPEPETPPRGTSPAPDSEPAAPSSAPPPRPSSPTGLSPVSVTSDVIAASEFISNEQPVLPFRGGSPSASTPPKPGVPWGLPFARPGEAAPPPLDPLPTDPAFDFDEATTRRNIAARRRATTMSLDDSPAHAPTMDPSDLPAVEAPEPEAAPAETPSAPIPPASGDASASETSSVDATAIAHEQGTALARAKADGSHLSLAHYAVLCASCGAFPRRVAEAHAKFGIASRVARESLDRAWDTRFQQQPEAQELWQALVTRYRAMLVEHGGH